MRMLPSFVTHPRLTRLTDAAPAGVIRGVVCDAIAFDRHVDQATVVRTVD